MLGPSSHPTLILSRRCVETDTAAGVVCRGWSASKDDVIYNAAAGPLRVVVFFVFCCAESESNMFATLLATALGAAVVTAGPVATSGRPLLKIGDQNNWHSALMNVHAAGAEEQMVIFTRQFA